MRRAPPLWRRPDPLAFGPRLLTLDLGSVEDSFPLSSSTDSACFDAIPLSRRPLPSGRALPPLQRPPPAPAHDDSPLDAWSRRPHNERVSLPPIELSPPPLPPPPCVAGASDSELSWRRSGSRQAPCGVRKTRRSRLRPRSTTARAVLARMFRRKGAGALCGGKAAPVHPLLPVLGTLRAGWTPTPTPTPSPTQISSTRCNFGASSPSVFASECEERRSACAGADCGGDVTMLRRAALAELPPRACASPGLMRRRYSVPETVMRRCRLARQISDVDRASTPGGGGRSPSGGSPSRATSDRESVRRCALMRRMWGRIPPAGASPPPCRCGASGRSLDESHSDSYASRPPWPPERRRQSPAPYSESCDRTSSTPRYVDRDTVDSVDTFDDRPIVEPEHDSSVARAPPERSTIRSSSDGEREPVPSRGDLTDRPDAPFDLLEIAVSETSQSATTASPDRTAIHASPPSPSSAPPPRPQRLFKPPVTDRNIDEYVSDILVESLNSLTDRLETITASTDGRMSVIEKEIKVKLQNSGVDTVAHSSPTSNRQIVFGNEELCERDTNAALERVQSLFRTGGEEGDARFPPSASVEGQASNGTCAGGGSPCTSLVDSLDDPTSPRLPLEPSSTSANRPGGDDDGPRGDRSESFFVRLEGDDRDCEKGSLVVADRMPERIKRRLQRRHRRRERHAEMMRRGRGRGAGAGGAAVERTCAALVDSLVDEAIARIVREEYRCMRIGRGQREATPSTRLRVSTDAGRQRSDRKVPQANRPAPRLAPATAPAPAPAPATVPRVVQRDRAPRRLYHKSEIHDGEKCIEILEIVEYANASRSSSDTASDESPNVAKCRKSRIPVPIPDETRRPRRAAVPARAPAPPPPPAEPAARRASLRSDTLRFERVFEAIPEERAGVASASSRSSGEAPVAPRSPQRRTVAIAVAAGPAAHPGGESFASSASGRRRSVGVQCATVLDDEGEGRRFRSTSAGRSDADEVAPPTHASASSEADSPRAPHDKRAHPPPQPPRRAQRTRRPRHAHAPLDAEGAVGASDGGWSLTVAGSCRAALPARLEMRVRFPSPRGSRPATDAADYADTESQDTERSSSRRRRAHRRSPRATRTRARAAILARETSLYDDRDSPPRTGRRAKRNSEILPSLPFAPRRGGSSSAPRDLQAYCRCCARSRSPASPPPAPAQRRSQSHRRGARRPSCPGCGEPRSYASGLAVQGAGIVPLRKPRAPSMSERDLVRRATPAHQRRAALAADRHRPR